MCALELAPIYKCDIIPLRLTTMRTRIISSLYNSGANCNGFQTLYNWENNLQTRPVRTSLTSYILVWISMLTKFTVWSLSPSCTNTDVAVDDITTLPTELTWGAWTLIHIFNNNKVFTINKISMIMDKMEYLKRHMTPKVCTSTSQENSISNSYTFTIVYFDCKNQNEEI